MTRHASHPVPACAALLAASPLRPRQPPDHGVERNVVYGMYSGLGLLLDVHRPAKPNGFGVVFISGSGWQAAPEYGADAAQGTADRPVGTAAARRRIHRVRASTIAPRRASTTRRRSRTCSARSASCVPREGLRHRSRASRRRRRIVGRAPRRARRACWRRPAIRPMPIAVNRESAALQAIVLRAAVARPARRRHGRGHRVRRLVHGGPAVAGASAAAAYAAASPITHVTDQSPPTLLIHGDADMLVPLRQSTVLEAGSARPACR